MPPELIGYADRFSVRPGEPIRFMVSSEQPTYDAALVRLIHADPNPQGPGFKEQLIQTRANKQYPGRKQIAYSGSYIIVEPKPALADLTSLTLQAWIRPTTPTKGQPQGIITHWSEKEQSGYGLYVGEQGDLALWLGSGGNADCIFTGKPMRTNEWYFVAATYDAEKKTAALYQIPIGNWPNDPSQATLERSAQAIGQTQALLLIAAGYSVTVGGNRIIGRGKYNGKIDSPRVFSRPLTPSEIDSLRQGKSPADVAGNALIAAWDFSVDMSSDKITDTSKNQLHGTMVNMAMRGVPGYNWTGSTVDFKQAPAEFGAIHFHDDDISDARWDVDFTLTVPADLKSGVYAARLRSGDQTDYIPFFVRPPKGKTTASTLVLFPTNTYLAYANEHAKGFEEYAAANKDRKLVRDPLDIYLFDHPELGVSIYDLHSDGHGCCYSSRLRPIVNMRPSYVMWLLGSPRHFPADLYLTDWLEQKGFTFDIATDEDLHLEGQELLSKYKVILTCSHPEYWTAPMLASLEHYRDSGGRIMYLGGNGFYWVTSMDSQRPHMVEIRRGYGGTRTWSSLPGEYYHALTGEVGGLWRHRGQAPNKMVGVGFTAQGWIGQAPGYRRKPGSFDPRAAFIFEGVGKDEMIGDFGLALGGTAGDELDRADIQLGTPAHALILASSEGHDKGILPVIEDFDLISPQLMTREDPTVHADMVYFETPNNGAVFSTGAITWISGLSHNNYDNNVSRITENVLRKFLA